MSAVNGSAHRYFITEETINQIEQEIVDGNDKRFLSLLEPLSKANIDHPFMRQMPKLCCKLIPLVGHEWKEGKISKEQVDKIVLQFAKNNVFTSGDLAEEFEMVCKDKTVVRLNHHLLHFVSPVCKTEYESGFREAGTLKMDFSQEYQAATVEAMKSFLYTGTLPAIEDISLLKELHSLSRFLCFEPLKEHCENTVMERANRVVTKDDLKMFVSLFGSSEVEEQLKAEVLSKALKSFLTANCIQYTYSREEGHINLSVSQLGLLVEPGALGVLLSIFTNGILIEHENQLEEIELLSFMPENLREQFTELTFSIPPADGVIRMLALNFHNVTFVKMPVTQEQRVILARDLLLGLSYVQRPILENLPKVGSIHYADCVKESYFQLKLLNTVDLETLAKLAPIIFSSELTVSINEDLLGIIDTDSRFARFLQSYQINESASSWNQGTVRHYILKP